MTLLEERTAPVPRSVEAEERLLLAVLREAEELPLLRLVVAELLPVERLVRVFWSTVPAERVVELPVVAELREVVELPVLRWVEELLPVERVVLVF